MSYGCPLKPNNSCPDEQDKQEGAVDLDLETGLAVNKTDVLFASYLPG